PRCPFLPRSWRARRAGKHSCAPGGTAGFCFGLSARASRLWFLQKSKKRDFWHLLKKQPLASRAGTHSPLGAPPGARQKRSKNERGNQNSKDRSKWQIDDLMGGAVGRSRQGAWLYPQSVQPVPQLQLGKSASGHVSVRESQYSTWSHGHFP